MRFQILMYILAILQIGCSTTSDANRCPNSSSTCRGLLSPSKSTQNSEELLPTTAGFEFEGSVPMEIEFHTVAEKVRDLLQRHFPRDRVRIETELNGWYDNTYMVIHERNGWEDRYTIKPETGLHFDKNTDSEIKGIEITAPIMRTRAQAKLFFNILDQLRDVGLKSRSDMAGNHIHWGLRSDMTYEDVLKVYQSVEKLLNIFKNDFAYNHGREQWIDIPHFLSIVRQLEKFVSENPGAKVFELDFEPIRRRTVLRVVSEYKSIEIRIFNSNLNPELNLFEFDFSMRLFDEVLKPKSHLLEYLSKTSMPTKEIILKLMSLDEDVATRSFQWSRRKVIELADSIEEKRQYPHRHRYVLPTPVEIAVDAFWQEPFDLLSFETKIVKIFETIQKRDQSIGLLNLISHRQFESLTEESREQLLNAIEHRFELQPFLQTEILVIRMVEDPNFANSLTQKIASMQSEDVSLLHPLIRRMLLRFDRHPDELAPVFGALAQDERALFRLFISYEKYLKVRRPQITDVHFGVLTELNRQSMNAEIALRSLKILDDLKFELKMRRDLLVNFFSALLPVTQKSRLVALEIFVTLDRLTRNDSRPPQYYIKDQIQFLDTVTIHLKRGSFPKLLSAWVGYLALVKNDIPSALLENYLSIIWQALERFGDQITGTERFNLKSSLSKLIFEQNSEVAIKIRKSFLDEDH